MATMRILEKPPPHILAARLAEALEMNRLGVAMMRENLKRRDPDASEEAIERALVAWLGRRDGAQLGDVDGAPHD